MRYKQLKSFDASKAGTKKYWCLQNVRLGYGIGGKYDYAIDDWRNNQQHADGIPADVAVPVYFDCWLTLDGKYANYGHIGVRLPDGRVWTDGKYYNSVAEVASQYLANSKGKYLGWGESVNGVRVVESVPEPKKSNDEIATEVIQGKWGNGDERRRRLTEAGYDSSAIQSIVNGRVNTPAPQPPVEHYTVARGDTLSKIAGRYGTTWQKLHEMNRSVIGADPDKIYPGQKLRVK